MRQSSFAVVGAFLLASAVALVALFGASSGLVVSLVLSGVLAVLGGVVASITLGPVSVSWRHLIAAFYFVIAAAWPLEAVQAVVAGGATASGLAWLAVTAVGALAFAFFGAEILRDGEHVDVTPNVDRDLGS